MAHTRINIYIYNISPAENDKDDELGNGTMQQLYTYEEIG